MVNRSSNTASQSQSRSRSRIRGTGRRAHSIAKINGWAIRALVGFVILAFVFLVGGLTDIAGDRIERNQTSHDFGLLNPANGLTIPYSSDQNRFIL